MHITYKRLPMHEIIIVGSGASGVAAALQLSHMGIKPLILDVGFSPKERIEDAENLYVMKASRESASFLIGNDLSYFKPEKQNLPAKLKSPYFDFVTDEPKFFDVHQQNYNIITSYAKGGLANAWGNGLMRCSSEDFEELPISLKDLAPYYDKLEEEIGISGRNDDLSQFFGQSTKLQQPLKLAHNAQKILKGYSKKRSRLNDKHIYIGTPRIGVSENDYKTREGCRYDNLEFWQPEHPSLYSPSMTLDTLIAEGKVTYKKGVFVDRWEEQDGQLEVVAYSVDSREECRFSASKLMLASGVVNTARTVLKSRNDYSTKLRLMDNPAIQFPLFFPTGFGHKLEENAFGLTQLNLIYQSNLLNQKVIGAFLEVTSPMRSEFFDKFPFIASDNINFMKYILPGMMACQIFLPSNPMLSAELSLEANNDIIISGTDETIPQSQIQEAVAVLRKLGLWTLEGFAHRVSHGNGIHYGGTLPMSTTPSSPYETTVDGELSKNKNIFVIDGSVFGYIPATNYSLTVMANAMRIAKTCGEQQ